jgi:hypothetical protein
MNTDRVIPFHFIDGTVGLVDPHTIKHIQQVDGRLREVPRDENANPLISEIVTDTDTFLVHGNLDYLRLMMHGFGFNCPMFPSYSQPTSKESTEEQCPTT